MQWFHFTMNLPWIVSAFFIEFVYRTLPSKANSYFFFLFSALQRKWGIAGLYFASCLKNQSLNRFLLFDVAGNSLSLHQLSKLESISILFHSFLDRALTSLAERFFVLSMISLLIDAFTWTTPSKTNQVD